MCRIKNNLDVVCAGLKNCVKNVYVWGGYGVQSRGGLKDKQGRGGVNAAQNGTLDLQHGTIVVEYLHPCIIVRYPKQGFLPLKISL